MQKNNNGFHSEGLSVSGLSLFTSVAEQKLRTSEKVCPFMFQLVTRFFPSEKANRPIGLQ